MYDGKKLAQKNASFWPRPIFTPSCPSIIVSAEAFQDSVREGKSWVHLAQETRMKRSLLTLVPQKVKRREFFIDMEWHFFRNVVPPMAGFHKLCSIDT